MNKLEDARSPRRWKDGGADLLQLEGMADALSALGAQHASVTQVARLEAKLAPLLAAPTFAASSTIASGAGAWLRAGRAWPWMSVLVIGAAITWGIGQRAMPQRVAPRATKTAHPVGVQLARQPSPAVPPTAAHREADLPMVAPASAHVPRKSANGTSPLRAAPPPTVVSPEAELLLLRQAQSALNRSASSALPILSEHEVQYPNGLFVQEREMLRIEAELTLGRRKQALSRASRFATRFPGSTYRARIDTLLATHASLKDRETPTTDVTQ